MPLSKKILSFLKELKLNIKLPAGIELMNPFMDTVTFNLCNQFYAKYYNNNKSRHLILGINPGRFGGGVTGIPFTDPFRLQNICGIENVFPKKQELSSVFVYQMIHTFGGPEIFYNKFYISAISPLGFTKHNKNLNYYDDKKLEESLKEFIIDCMKVQLKFGINREIAFCLGEGKNFKYFSNLNNEYKFFKQIIALPHPRFIMQYKLKKKEEYIERYLWELKNVGCKM
jgi:hypothetical protein